MRDDGHEVKQQQQKKERREMKNSFLMDVAEIYSTRSLAQDMHLI